MCGYNIRNTLFQRRLFLLKIKILSLPIALLAAALLFAGCRNHSAQKEELKQLKPSEVVNRVLTGIRSGETDSLPDYFSAAMDPEDVKTFLNKSSSLEIDTLRVSEKPDERKKIAFVPYMYVYREKKTARDGREETGPKMRKTGIAVLAREDGIWKIRLLDAELEDRDGNFILKSLDSALDRSTEEKRFKDCILAVEITKLAEQMFSADNKGDFTRSQDMLRKYIKDYDSSTCDSLEIHSIGVNAKGEMDYRITALTRNMPACTIWATKDKTYPSSYGNKCLSQKTPLEM